MTNGLNNIHSNVWGVFIIIVGAAISFTKHPDIALTLISIGAVLLKQGSGSEIPQGTTTVTTEKQ